MIANKRVYEAPGENDGYRILVDRMWPRGLSKDKAKVDLWLKEVAPSDGLRKWFGHKSERWREFRDKYFKELERKGQLVDLIEEKLAHGKVTFLYGAKNREFNNAVALKEYIEKK